MTIPVLLASLVIILIISLGLSGLGLLIASFTDSMEGLTLLWLHCNAHFPLEWCFIPGYRITLLLQVAVYLDPLTYGGDALRGIILQSQPCPYTWI
jgi:ABC-2 type transport system permease protein